MAARLCPDNVRQTHQSLHHIVAHAPWNDEDILEAVRRYALPAMASRKKREDPAGDVCGRELIENRSSDYFVFVSTPSATVDQLSPSVDFISTEKEYEVGDVFFMLSCSSTGFPFSRLCLVQTQLSRCAVPVQSSVSPALL
jgi:hypothetical protein